MSLIRPLVEMQNQMDRLFGDITQGFNFPREEYGTRLHPQEQRVWMPAIELSETDNEYVLSAEVPGVQPDKLDIEVTGNILTISGESQSERKEEGRNVHRSEFRYGRFLRRIQLPGEVKSENAKAEFKNGVLELHLPKSEAGKSRKIKVQSK